VGSGKARFKQLRQLVTTTSGILLLVGCANTATRLPSSRPAPPQPLDHLTVATLPPERDVMAQLLEGDFALSRTDLPAASAAYGRAAQLSNNPAVAERAAQLALATHDQAASDRAMTRWQQLGAKPAQLAAMRAELALDRGQGDEARKQLQLLVDTHDPDAWRDFGRVLVNARDSAQAARMLEAVATPDRLPNDSEAWLAMSELGDRLGRHDYAQKTADAALAKFHDARSYAWAGQMRSRRATRPAPRPISARPWPRARRTSTCAWPMPRCSGSPARRLPPPNCSRMGRKAPRPSPFAQPLPPSAMTAPSWP